MMKLRPYQQTAASLAVENNVLLLDECGLGKTLEAIEAIRLYRYAGQFGPVLVITPKRVREQWVEQIHEQFPGDKVLMLGVAGRMPAGEDLRLVDWVITHYQGVTGAGPQLARINWLAVIVDEAHRIKNRKAKQTKWIKLLPARHKLALTGTPMDERPDDIWSIVNWLYPKKFSSYWKWFDAFCETEENFLGFKEVKGIKNVGLLAKTLSPFTLRRTKQQVAPDLPERLMSRVGVELDGRQKVLYEQIEESDDIELKLDDGVDWTKDILILNTLSQIVKKQQMSSDPKLFGANIESAKIEWVKDYVYDNPEEVIVIFTKFRDTAIRLAGELDAGLLIGGSDPSKYYSFIAGHKRLLVGTIAAMGEGLNLQRAKTAIFLDQEWSAIKMQQAIDRIHRINITEPKNIIYMYTKDSIDHLVLQALDQKWTNAELVYHYLKMEADE